MVFQDLTPSERAKVLAILILSITLIILDFIDFLKTTDIAISPA